MGLTIVAEIERFVRECPDNRLPELGGPYFDAPLVGFASAADPLFDDYHRIIGEFHRTPQEAMADALGAGVRAATVICWVLPISREARRSNRRESRLPSRAWAETRAYGERGVNVALRKHLVGFLEARGHRAMAPLLAPGWKELATSPVGPASTWSERHAAFAAGLGTFSLNDSLITARGTAHRLGSVVTDLAVPPTPRPYAGHRDYCLHARGVACGVCAGRCPVQAVTLDGHDKVRCRELVYGAGAEQVKAAFGVPLPSCGLCQTKVPCEDRIPPMPRRAAGRQGGVPPAID
jgi:epoxyqueuosine reductase QueG